jgi:hypothetical protein
MSRELVDRLRFLASGQDDVHSTAITEAANEIERLRQGLWDCFKEAGGDTDGDATPRSLISDLVPLALDCVRDLRQCYDDVLTNWEPAIR